MKTVKQEEPVTRSRFIECPGCKSKGLKLKRIVQAGRCKNCHESYKIIIMFVKTGGKAKTSEKTPTEGLKIEPITTPPSWEMPSDTSLFGTTAESGDSTFSSTSFDWGSTGQEKESGSTGEQ